MSERKTMHVKMTYGHDGDRTPAAEVGGESVTTLPPWPLKWRK